MSRTERIKAILNEHFSPSFLEVSNFSHEHNVPAGSDSHIKVSIGSTAFDGKRSIQRHRMVYAVLSAELENGLHALQLQTFSSAEIPVDVSTPKCRGGEK